MSVYKGISAQIFFQNTMSAFYSLVSLRIDVLHNFISIALCKIIYCTQFTEIVPLNQQNKPINGDFRCFYTTFETFHGRGHLGCDVIFVASNILHFA